MHLFWIVLGWMEGGFVVPSLLRCRLDSHGSIKLQVLVYAK